MELVQDLWWSEKDVPAMSLSRIEIRDRERGEFPMVTSYDGRSRSYKWLCH
jgi:hypothetical protein